LGLILPALTGAFVAWYCLRNLHKHEDLAHRIVILISTFILFLFADVYIASLGTLISKDVNVSLMPNLTFTLGVSLYIIFKYKHQVIAASNNSSPNTTQ
jgi:hypothetical protein